LGWWATVSSMVVGYAIGALLVTPMGLLGPRTGSNNSVASGAQFGVLGRLVGSVIGLLIALCYVALAIWAGGQAIVAPAARLLGTPDSALAYGLGYAAVAIIVAIIAIYGFQLLERAQKLLVPTVGALTLTGFIAFLAIGTARLPGGKREVDQVLRLPHRQRPQNQCLDQRGRGHRRTKGEAQREERGAGDQPVLRQHPRPDPDVVQQRHDAEYYVTPPPRLTVHHINRTPTCPVLGKLIWLFDTMPKLALVGSVLIGPP